MKRMTKFGMAQEIGKVRPWNPMTVYWDRFTWAEVKEEYDRVIAREEARKEARSK